ncbi:MAG: ERF family protein [Isosphaeraceae bacterium]
MNNPTNGTAAPAVRTPCAPIPGEHAQEPLRVQFIQGPAAAFIQAMPPAAIDPPPPIPGEGSPRTDRLIAALAEARRSIRRIAKDSTNSHHGNRYADLAACREAVVAACLPAGLWVRQHPEAAPEGYPATWRLRTTIVHAESGQWISSTVPMLVGPGANPMQAFASAETYACRYALRDEFALVIADDDDDANGAGFVPAPHAAPKAAPQANRRPDPTPARPAKAANPSNGKALFRWARGEEERGRRGVVEKLTKFFEGQGYKGRMVELTEGDLSEYKAGLVDLYPELFGDDAAEGGAA